MKIFDKVKSLFTEEIEEVKAPNKEVKYQFDEEQVEKENKSHIVEIKEEPKKEEKSVFFDDKDFDDLDRKFEFKKEEPKTAYNGKLHTVNMVEEKKIFKPTPIISPIYGVLDTNYTKDQIVERKKIVNYKVNDAITIDDVRNRAFSTLEDELKNDLLGNDYNFEVNEEQVTDELEIFEDNEVDPIIEFEEIVQTREHKNQDLIEKVVDEDDTEFLSQKLDEQKKKLDEITQILRNRPNIVENITVVEYNEEIEEPTIEESLEEEKESNIDDVFDNSIDDEEIEENNIDDAFANSIDDLEDAINESESEKMDDKKLFDIIDSIYDEEGSKK